MTNTGTTQRRVPELLAPAGGPEHLRAALAAGADAVYLGLRRFSMRVRASNFEGAELAEACELAHRAGRRIYLAMNNLVFDGEWDACRRALDEALGAGVDGVIVQDLGLLRRIARSNPEVELHVSTQATVHHPGQLPVLAAMGVRRVILAREMSFAEVRDAVAAGRELGVQIECFVHGALCVSYAGQCQAGALLEGRSGNRGACPQLCRRSWTAEGEGGHPHCLSLKDLMAVDRVAALAEAGVASLKIEGRLKRPEFVFGMVRAYRRALDAWTAGRPVPVASIEKELEGLFHRGFTGGGLAGELALSATTRGDAGRRFPLLGRVEAVDGPRQRIALSGTRLPAPGDALLLRRKDGDEASFFVTRIFDGDRPPWIGVKGDPARFASWQGAEVRLSTERALLDELAAGYAGWEPPPRPLDMAVSGRPGQPLRLAVGDGAGTMAHVESAMPLGEAARRPLDEEILRKQLGRLGGTGWGLRRLDVDLAAPSFLPMAELNRLRREAVAAVDAARPRPAGAAPFLDLEPPRAAEGRPLLRAFCRSAEAVALAERLGFDELLLPPTAALWQGAGETPRLLLSPAVTPPDAFAAFFDFLSGPGRSARAVVAGNLAVAAELGRRDLPFWLDGSCNLANRAALEAVAPLGPAGAALARELGPRRWDDLVGKACLPVELVLLERPPLFQLAMVDFGRRVDALEDEEGRRLLVRPWTFGTGATLVGPWRDALGERRPCMRRAARLRVEVEVEDAVALEEKLDALRAFLAVEERGDEA